MITKTEAKNLFTELKGVARRGEELIVEIIETRAWEPLGYPSLATAWSSEIGDDVVIFSKRVRLAIIREFARTDDLDNLPKIYGISEWVKKRMIEQYNFGVPFQRIGEANWWGEQLEEIYALDEAPADWDAEQWAYQKARFSEEHLDDIKWLSKDRQRAHNERVVVRRRATTAHLPSKPSTLHIRVGEAEYERVTRVMNAAGKFPSDLVPVITGYIDRLEASLKVSV